jgi:hypothetical protein
MPCTSGVARGCDCNHGRCFRPALPPKDEHAAGRGGNRGRRDHLKDARSYYPYGLQQRRCRKTNRDAVPRPGTQRSGPSCPQATVLEQWVNMKKQLVMALGFGLALAISTAPSAQAAGAGGTAGGSSAGGSVGGSPGGSTAPAANGPSSAPTPNPNPSSPNTVPQSNETPVSPGTSPGAGAH